MKRKKTHHDDIIWAYIFIGLARLLEYARVYRLPEKAIKWYNQNIKYGGRDDGEIGIPGEVKVWSIILVSALVAIFVALPICNKVMEEQPVQQVEDSYYELEVLKDILEDKGSTTDGLAKEAYLRTHNIQYTAKDYEDGARHLYVTKGKWELQVVYWKTEERPCRIGINSVDK